MIGSMITISGEEELIHPLLSKDFIEHLKSVIINDLGYDKDRASISITIPNVTVDRLMGMNGRTDINIKYIINISEK